jgi:anti-sigma factor RsiW
MNPCPDPWELLEGLDAGDPSATQHLSTCEGCSALVEEHRQLEKDLYRLSDPLPPKDFVSNVMARVEEEPVPVGVELSWGLSILGAAAMLFVLAFVHSHGHVGATSAWVASSLVSARVVAGSLFFALGAAWHAAAAPLMVALGGVLTAALLGLSKLSPQGGSQTVRAS